MKEYVSLIDGLPLILKVILSLPVFDNVVYGIYRIAKGRLLVGILWILIAGWVGFIIDLYTILTKGKVTFLT